MSEQFHDDGWARIRGGQLRHFFRWKGRQRGYVTACGRLSGPRMGDWPSIYKTGAICERCERIIDRAQAGDTRSESGG